MLCPKNKKMKKSSHNGLALIRRSQNNLEWWLNTSHSNKLTRQAYILLHRIHQDFNEGIKNLCHFKRLELFIHMDEYFDKLKIQDPIAHAVDIRIIHNLPKNGILNEGYVIKAAPYNITYNG